MLELLDRNEIAATTADLGRILAEIGSAWRLAGGIVGDSDPRLAPEDAMHQFAADEVVIVNPPDAEIGTAEQAATE